MVFKRLEWRHSAEPGSVSGREAYNPLKPFNDEIRRQIVLTHPSSGPLIVTPSGKRFRVEREASHAEEFYEMHATDGIGTKGILHWEMGTIRNGARDVFAMVMDDLIERGHVPAHFQDHIMMQTEDKGRIFEITRTLVGLSRGNPWSSGSGEHYPIIITGGETAIINTLKGFEIGITAVGYVRKGHEIVHDARPGDLVIGIASNGVHSNGLSFLREGLLEEKRLGLDHVMPWGVTLGNELTRPTRIYLPALKGLIETDGGGGRIHGMVHITGGGLSKLGELFGGRYDADIEVSGQHSLRPQDIFRYVQREFGISSDKMYSRFNSGIGYAVAVAPEFAVDALAALRRHRFKTEVIGKVVMGSGNVIIKSQYGPEDVAYSKSDK